MSNYVIQVRHVNGQLAATFQPGSTAEKDFLTAVIENASEKGIGAFTPLWLVKRRLTSAFEEELHKIKKNVRPS